MQYQRLLAKPLTNITSHTSKALCTNCQSSASPWFSHSLVVFKIVALNTLVPSTDSDKETHKIHFY